MHNQIIWYCNTVCLIDYFCLHLIHYLNQKLKGYDAEEDDEEDDEDGSAETGEPGRAEASPHAQALMAEKSPL